MKSIITVASLLALSSTTAFGKFKFSGDTSFYSNIINNKETEARLFGTAINFKAKRKLSRELKALVHAKAILETGSNNSQNNKDYSPTQKIALSEAYLSWSPLSFFNLKAGAINQGHYNSPLLLSSSAFMGAVQKVSYKGENFKIFAKAQQAIPNNDTLTQRYGGVEQGTPAVFIETIGLHANIFAAKVALEASQFSFNKLSNGVAYNSQFGGNRTTGTSESDSLFLYKFQGFNIYSMISVPVISNTFKASVNYIHNNEAPTDRSNGLLLKAILKTQWLDIMADLYDIDSDIAPSFYNSREYGSNNRSGIAYGFAVNLPKDVKLTAKYYNNDVKTVENPYQSDSDNFAFTFNHIMKF